MKKRITIEELMALFGGGIIGKIESRSWLAREYPNFAKSRRRDVDEFLELLGTAIEEENIINPEDEESNDNDKN